MITQPTSNDISFLGLALNSLKIARHHARRSPSASGVTAAYAFSRLKFRGRETLMIVILGVLMLPAVATLVPLYVFLNQFRIELRRLRLQPAGLAPRRDPRRLLGAAAVRDLEPQGLPRHDPAATSRRRPPSTARPRTRCSARSSCRSRRRRSRSPGSWASSAAGREYLTVYYFIGGNVPDWTLSIALNSMVGQFARNTPWSEFAAFAILFALPVSLVFFFFQRYLVGGLAVGGVKG